MTTAEAGGKPTGEGFTSDSEAEARAGPPAGARVGGPPDAADAGSPAATAAPGSGPARVLEQGSKQGDDEDDSEGDTDEDDDADDDDDDDLPLDPALLERMDPLELERLMAADDAALPSRPCPDLPMLIERNLPEALQEEASAAQLRAAVAALTHVRLDRERLLTLGPSLVPPLGAGVTNLYLQHNRLESMAAVAHLPHLRFLTVASNVLPRIEGVAGLANLLFLDASDNRISSLPAGALPLCLAFFKIAGNPVVETEGIEPLTQRLLAALPDLRKLDGASFDRRTGSDDDDDEEEEEEEEEGGQVKALAAAATAAVAAASGAARPITAPAVSLDRNTAGSFKAGGGAPPAGRPQSSGGVGKPGAMVTRRTLSGGRRPTSGRVASLRAAVSEAGAAAGALGAEMDRLRAALAVASSSSSGSRPRAGDSIREAGEPGGGESEAGPQAALASLLQGSHAAMESLTDRIVAASRDRVAADRVLDVRAKADLRDMRASLSSDLRASLKDALGAMPAPAGSRGASASRRALSARDPSGSLRESRGSLALGAPAGPSSGGADAALLSMRSGAGGGTGPSAPRLATPPTANDVAGPSDAAVELPHLDDEAPFDENESFADSSSDEGGSSGERDVSATPGKAGAGGDNLPRPASASVGAAADAGAPSSSSAAMMMEELDDFANFDDAGADDDSDREPDPGPSLADLQPDESGIAAAAARKQAQAQAA